MNRLVYFLVLFLTLQSFSIAQSAEEKSVAEEALRATIRITNGSTSGTGFFVSIMGEKTGAAPKVFLVSAAHVFEDLKGAECKLILRAAGPGGNVVRKEHAFAIREGDKPLWTRHAEVDVAAIPFEPPADIDMTPFTYPLVANADWAAEGHVRVGQDVFIPCYPAQLEANASGWPVLRKGSIASHPLTPLSAAKTMLVDYSHFGGDSGAPVVAQGKDGPVVLGVVTAMQRQTDRVSSPFEERTIHTPLGLAVVVQSPFIRETIDKLIAD